MAGPATILREIHRLRRFAKELQNENERIPRVLRGQQTKAARQEEALKQAQDDLKHLKVTAHEKEVEHKQTLQDITKHEDQLNRAGSKKEYDGLKIEIATGKKHTQDLEDEILETLTRIDDRTAEIPALEKALKEAKAEYAAFEKQSAARQSELAGQLQQTLKQVEEVEASLPEDIRPQYNRLIAARGEDALAAVQNRTCMACYTEITAQNYNDLVMNQFLVCKSCGRALYLPDE